MKDQKGAALIVVLSLLAVSLMVGLSSMQSSQLDERLAGNYKAQAESQMGAEEAASFAFGELLSKSKGKSDFSSTIFSHDQLLNMSIDDFKQEDGFNKVVASSGGCQGVDCYFRYVSLDGGGYYILAMGAAGGAISEVVLVEVDGGVTFGFIPEAALTCVGNNCGLDPDSGSSGPILDGIDRRAGGRVAGSSRPEPVCDNNNNKVFFPAALMPDMGSGVFSEGKKRRHLTKGDFVIGGSNGGRNPDLGCKSNDEIKDAGVIGGQAYDVTGYEKIKEDRLSLKGESFDPGKHGWEATKAEMKSEIQKAVDSFEYQSNVVYIGKGESISPGRFQGIVVVDGGTLSLGVSDEIEGVVVMKGGNIDAQGVASIVGAVVGEDFLFTGGGELTILYSSEAVGKVAEQGSSTDLWPRIVSWK